jgi:hypothetical protein
LKSPVRENRPPGSVRGAPGNRRPYLDLVLSWYCLGTLGRTRCRAIRDGCAEGNVNLELPLDTV